MNRHWSRSGLCWRKHQDLRLGGAILGDPSRGIEHGNRSSRQILEWMQIEKIHDEVVHRLHRCCFDLHQLHRRNRHLVLHRRHRLFLIWVLVLLLFLKRFVLL